MQLGQGVGHPGAGQLGGGPKAAAWVLPSCSVVRRDRAVGPTPFALRAKSHIGLNLDPVRARVEDRWSRQIYRKHGAALHDCLVHRAVNLGAGKAGAIGVKEDIAIVRTIQCN